MTEAIQPTHKIDILAIGSSTGGPDALLQLLEQLPKHFPIPIVITQHIAQKFDNVLVQRLKNRTSLSIFLAQDGETLKGGGVWVAPWGKHLEVVFKQGSFKTHLSDGPPQNSCKPSVDVLFQSLVKVYRKNILSVILTGMGSDGLNGAKSIKDAGGNVLVQDKSSSIVWGMPGAVYKAGLADGAFNLKDLALKIIQHASYMRQSENSLSLPTPPRTKPSEPKDSAEDEFNALKEIIYKNTGVSLPPSKHYLVMSRLQAILEKQNIPNINELLKMIKKQSIPQKTMLEIIDLLLTHETSFFRDSVPFKTLEKEVIPDLLKTTDESNKITIWSTACSYGQEPYSIAIVLLEYFSEILHNKTIEIIATDVSDSCLNKAQTGIYTSFDVQRGLDSRLLLKYFTKSGKDWIIKDNVRSLVKFKKINLIQPWPSSQSFDIIFCRNVLIYFEQEDKKRVLQRIENTLSNQGYLFLGGGESTVGLNQHFKKVLNNGACCYQINKS